MGNLKPFQVIIMAVFGLIALLGLFLFANFQGFSNGVKPLGTVTIWGTLPAEAMTLSINTLKQTNPEFGGITYVSRSADTFNADLAEAIASGQGPDLIVISQEDLLATKNKISLIPSSSISERTFRDSYLPVSELYLTEGGTYGIPFVVDPMMLYYNRPVLASAGAARPPSTWEAVTGLAAGINRLTDAQTISRSIIAIGTYENVDHARGIISLLFLQSGYTISEQTPTGIRSNLARTSTQTFGSSPAESALNFYTEFANPGKTVYSWNRSLPKSRDSFIAGDLGLYLGYASERAALAEANPNLDFDMAAVPSPATLATRMTYGKAYAFAIPKSSRNASGAFRAAMGLTNKDALPMIAHALGMAPAQRALLAPRSGDLYEPVYFPEALIARGWLSPEPTSLDRIFGTMVGNVISGRESVRDALYTADQSLTAALK
ncbi:extracellular solute-binding protein [Patescibacteria group bacterium]|nr:extracellular solute-binding protein [Patescibacteria group bacterium]